MAFYPTNIGGSRETSLTIKAMITSYWLGNYIALSVFDAESGEAMGGATSSNPPKTYDLEHFTIGYAANATVTITAKKTYDVYSIDRDGNETYEQSLPTGESITFTQRSRLYIFK